MNNCPLCNGYKLVPCQKCRGSKNSIANDFTTTFRALRCTNCNENGLEPCPECFEREKKKEEEETEEFSSESSESDQEGEYEVTEGVEEEEEEEEEEQVKRVRRGERRRSEAAHWAELRMKANIGRREEEEKEQLFEEMVSAMAANVLQEALSQSTEIPAMDTEENSERNESTHWKEKEP